jgi:hypothetical protein
VATGGTEQRTNHYGGEVKNASSLHDQRIVVKSGQKTTELRYPATACGGEWRGARDQLGFAHGQ